MTRYVYINTHEHYVSCPKQMSSQVARDVCMIDSSTARLLELVTTQSKSCAKSVLSLFKTTTSQAKFESIFFESQK